jgi:quinol monooxygenase YgiN
MGTLISTSQARSSGQPAISIIVRRASSAMVESPPVLGTGACLNVAYGATMPNIIEKGTPMSQVMIVVEFEVKPEHRSQFIDLMRGHTERSRRDDGCLQFDLMLPKDDDNHVFLVEKWRNQEALDSHAKGPMPGNTYKDWIVGRKVARGAPAD